MAKDPYRPPTQEIRVGLADWLGLVAVLVLITVIPGQPDPLTGPKLLVLSVGAFAAVPAMVIRWRRTDRPGAALLIPAVAALPLVVWAAISAIGSAAPWSVSVFGWFGRGDGWLALASAAILLLAASTLDRGEVTRVITWLLWGGAIVAAIGLLEAVGVQLIPNSYPGVDATLGNPNFAAGVTAIIAVLAAGRALEPGRLIWIRVACAALALALAATSYLTASLQGPAALVAGLAAGWIIWVLAYRGARRVIALAVTGVGVVLGLVALGLSLVGVGPLTVLWADYTVQVRQQYWLTAWNMTLGQPIFGSGPDGFARYVSEDRPESYIELLGPVRRVSAAHNIALQFGATLGVIGLVLWVVLMGSLLVILLWRASRAQIVPVVLVAGVGGAWATYIVQGMVSIDMLPLLTLGWLMTGLLIAALKPAPPEPPPVAARKGRSVGRSAGPPPRTTESQTAVVVGVGAVLAVIPAILVGMQVSAISAGSNVATIDQAQEVLRNPLTTCPQRVDLAQAVLQSDQSGGGQALALEAYRLDPRCSPMASFVAQIALSQGDLALADEVTAWGVQIDPLFASAWLLRAEYLLVAGDTEGARIALAEAERLDALYPELGDAAPPDISAQVADLKVRIDAAAG